MTRVPPAGPAQSPRRTARLLLQTPLAYWIGTLINERKGLGKSSTFYTARLTAQPLSASSGRRRQLPAQGQGAEGFDVELPAEAVKMRTTTR